jgi:Protein of unknown function (DUF3631)
MIEYLHLPNNGDGKTGLDDFLFDHTVDELWTIVRPDPPQLEEPAPLAQLPSDAPVSREGSTEPVNGAELFENIRDWLATYIFTVTDADLDLLTLWAAHTHLVFETYTTPRLQIDSPVPESGKTTVLEHLQRLSMRSVLMSSLASPAMLTRMLHAEQRTILIDEADRSLNPDKDGVTDLFAVLNSGYKRGATRPVLVPGQGGQWEVREMPTFAAVAMAGNNPNLPDDTRTRIIRVLLLPDPDGTVEESDWELIEEDAGALHDQLADWADQVREQVRIERPALPDGITGRFREKWSPLKRIAAAAGGRWPDAVDVMALHDKEEYAMDREDGLVKEKPAVVLLSHIHEVWPESRHFVPTEELISWLVTEYPSVWGAEGPIGKSLTAKRLGGMLTKGYKIHSKREGRGTPRGYFRSDFTRAWNRMGVTPSLQSGESGASGGSGRDEASDSPDAPDTPEGVAEPVQTNGQRRYDTCAGCSRKMLILHDGQTTHPNCEKTPA